MFYLTDTVGMHVGIVGTLMAVSRLLDSITDLFFGYLLDKTCSKFGKARSWMLYGYVGCAIMLAAIFMIPESWGKTAQYVYFFITYTLLNAIFYTANNISYATCFQAFAVPPNSTTIPEVMVWIIRVVANANM